MTRLYGAGSGWHLLRRVCSKLVNQLSNNITAKLTNQCTQTGLSTFDWQQPFTWLWWWLPLRLSKRQSPLPTTVLLRTTPTRTIKLHCYMLPPGPNDEKYGLTPKGYVSPRRGIEPQSPAWQAGILTTILPRMSHYIVNRWIYSYFIHL